MKQKLITIVLTLTIILSQILSIPTSMFDSSNIAKCVVLLAGGLILLILLLASYKTLTIDKKDAFILLFLGLAFMSTLFSSNIKISILGANIRHEGLLMLITYVCIYFCAKKYYREENFKTFFNIMFYISLAIGILGIAQRHIKCKALYPLFNHGICATFGNSTFFGSYISIVLPASMAIFMFKGSKKSFIISILMFFNMISSGTRSAWVAFAVVVIIQFIYLIKQKNKLYWKRMGILLICFIVIFTYLFMGFDIVKNNTTKAKINQIKNDVKKVSENRFNK